MAGDDGGGEDDDGGGGGRDHSACHKSDKDTKKEEYQDPGREWYKQCQRL